jgi:uncharacterized membrane protein YfcA
LPWEPGATALANAVGDMSWDLGQRESDCRFGDRIRIGRLGIALIAYAASGLMNVRAPHVSAWAEWWLGTFVGGATGFITAATGVFVIPAVPYLQALSFEREGFMQALGLSFTVSTIALASSLVSAGTLNLDTGLYSLLALAPALAGMIAGQHLLRVIRPETFRRWFFSGLALLGAHLAVGVLW